MKKIKLYFVALILLIIPWAGVAQTKMINVEVGTEVPSTILKNIQDAAFSHADLAHLSRNKLVIIDFWATWCAPCLQALPKLESLREDFKEKMEVLTVTNETEEYVRRFFEKRSEQNFHVPRLPKIFGDTVLRKLFPHRIVPHYVWLFDGKVVAFTDEVTKHQIELTLERGMPDMPNKVDRSVMEYDKLRMSLTDFLQKNHMELRSKLITNSLLTGYIPELGANGGYVTVSNGDSRRITAVNTTLNNLYRIAYGKMKTFLNDGAVDIFTRDSLPQIFDVSGQKAIDLIEKIGLCYEIKVNSNYSMDIYNKMQFDLAEAFPQFFVSVEKAVDTCFVIECIDPNIIKNIGEINNVEAKYSFEDGNFNITNGTMAGFRTSLEAVILRYRNLPIVDNTGIDGKISMSLNGQLHDLQQLNDQLSRYGLYVSKKLCEHDRLIVRDRS